MDVAQWELIGPGPALRPGTGYTVRNRINDRSLRYGERDHGINLDWDRRADLANITFRRTSGDTSPIRFGERLAISVQGGRYLRYGERDEGINLVWSDTPVHEWELSDGVDRSEVPVRRRVRIVNQEHGDFLVYGERDEGINLRWWADLGIFGSYPPLPLPKALRSPSGEPGQAVLAGMATKVSVFHGGTDDELDWHIYVRPDDADRRRLFSHLLEHGRGARAIGFPPRALTESDLEQLACEWMVLDGYDNSLFDEKFFSADVTTALMLAKPAWDISAEAADDQNISGSTEDATNDCRLTERRARVYLQGPLVNDRAHSFKVEIHPLDSVAYALDERGEPLAIAPGSTSWPAARIHWRVAAFTNSSFHRINGADYLKRDRTTTWHLPVPTGVRSPSRGVLTVSNPGFLNVARSKGGLDDRRPTNSDRYESYGVVRQSANLAPNPHGRGTVLTVSVTMAQPHDRWGGMFLGDYIVRAR